MYPIELVLPRSYHTFQSGWDHLLQVYPNSATSVNEIRGQHIMSQKKICISIPLNTNFQSMTVANNIPIQCSIFLNF